MNAGQRRGCSRPHCCHGPGHGPEPVCLPTCQTAARDCMVAAISFGSTRHAAWRLANSLSVTAKLRQALHKQDLWVPARSTQALRCHQVHQLEAWCSRVPPVLADSKWVLTCSFVSVQARPQFDAVLCSLGWHDNRRWVLLSAGHIALQAMPLPVNPGHLCAKGSSGCHGGQRLQDEHSSICKPTCRHIDKAV